ncbi:MAG: pH regulation protein F [Chloroflexi bacterium]|nr:pH regulation protein F [Chloroflexota bacterium]
MHPAMFYLAVVWLVALIGASALVVIAARGPLVRILALDTLTLLLIALLTLFAQATSAAHYLDAALAFALLSFIGTLAAARYASEGSLFS